MRTLLVHLHPRPDTVAINRGRTVLVTGPDGMVAGGRHGLFVHQTRMLSRLRYRISGVEPFPVALSPVEQHRWLGYYVALPPERRSGGADGSRAGVGEAAQQALELRVWRAVGEGLHEDLDLINFTGQPTRLRLEVEVEGDFVDQSQAGQADAAPLGTVARRWEPVGDAWTLVLDHRAEHAYDQQGERGVGRLWRGLTVGVERADAPPGYADGFLTFDVVLPPRGRWHGCLVMAPHLDGVPLPVPPCPTGEEDAEPDRRRNVFAATATRVDAPGGESHAPVVVGALTRARQDLADLRLDDLDRGTAAWIPAAGLPDFVALFGRDALTAGWQAALLGPEMMRGALLELPRWQGQEVRPWRDEEPGRMLHEAHTGPQAVLGLTPRARYYGSITTSGFYPVVLAQYWHWTGDRETVRRLVAPALRALEWLDRDADRDGDGFYEYQTRSTQGLRHQAWKDSGDAIVHEDGSPADPPIATCEEQAFVYAAKFLLAEVLLWLGERTTARRLFRDARELHGRFNDVFWMDDAEFYAMGLDARKRPIRSIGSHAGHCLAAGIVPAERARPVADRLLAPDLFSGWGVRTLSSDHPAYNPYSYHRGSVWPVEQGTFALGFLRYGVHEHLHRLAGAQFELADLFPHARLPEVISGHPRDRLHPFPALYPQANWPQAWSASALWAILQALLGLYPYAPLRLLIVDPHLPPWLPELTVRNLRVGEATATIRFLRRPDGHSTYEVLEVRGPLRIIRQPSPWSLTAGWGERVAGVVGSLLPGRALFWTGAVALAAAGLAWRWRRGASAG